jgi:hypothetical protein
MLPISVVIYCAAWVACVLYLVYYFFLRPKKVTQPPTDIPIAIATTTVIPTRKSSSGKTVTFADGV